MANLQSILTFTDAVLATEVDGEAIMMDVDSARYFTLNRVGTEIMAGLRQGRSVGDVCADLAARYDAPAAQIEAETLALVDKIVARGLATLTA